MRRKQWTGKEVSYLLATTALSLMLQVSAPVIIWASTMRMRTSLNGCQVLSPEMGLSASKACSLCGLVFAVPHSRNRIFQCWWWGCARCAIYRSGQKRVGNRANASPELRPDSSTC